MGFEQKKRKLTILNGLEDDNTENKWKKLQITNGTREEQNQNTLPEDQGEGDASIEMGEGLPGAPGVPSQGQQQQNNNNVNQICRSEYSLAKSNNIRIYKKSFIVRTWGMQVSQIDIKDQTTTIRSAYQSSSLCSLPVNATYFYISPGEFEDLPRGSRAEFLKCKATPKGFRAPFQTGESSVGAANSQMLVFAHSAVGLNKEFNSAHAQLDATAELPTKPTGFIDPDTNIEWGNLIYNDNTTANVSWTNDLVPFRLPQYFCWDKIHAIDSPANSITLANYVNTFDIRTHVGLPCLNWEYKVKMGHLKGMFQQTISDYPQKSPWDPDKIQIAPDGSNLAYQTLLQFNKPVGDAYTSFSKQNFRGYTSIQMHDQIEKHAYLKYQYEGHSKEKEAVPGAYIGVTAPLTSNPFASSPSFAEVMAYWQVDTEMVVCPNWYSAHTDRHVMRAKDHLISYVPSITTYDSRKNIQRFVDGIQVYSGITQPTTYYQDVNIEDM